MPNQANVNQMTAEDRLSEVADILARGLLRLRFRTRVATESFLGNPLEVERDNSPHVAHTRKIGMTI